MGYTATEAETEARGSHQPFLASGKRTRSRPLIAGVRGRRGI